MTGTDVAAVVRAGAVAAQLGTAFLRCPESGASGVHKAALSDARFTVTAITRAFSGRRARGLVNDFMRAHPDAPSAYPHINNATRALRRESVARGDAQGTNLWAGQGFRLARAEPAAEVTTDHRVRVRGCGLDGATGPGSSGRRLGTCQPARAPDVGTGWDPQSGGGRTAPWARGCDSRRRSLTSIAWPTGSSYRVLGDRGDAEDVAQEALARAHLPVGAGCGNGPKAGS